MAAEAALCAARYIRPRRRVRAQARGGQDAPANPSGGMLRVGRAGLRRCAQAAFHVRDARAPGVR